MSFCFGRRKNHIRLNLFWKGVVLSNGFIILPRSLLTVFHRGNITWFVLEDKWRIIGCLKLAWWYVAKKIAIVRRIVYLTMKKVWQKLITAERYKWERMCNFISHITAEQII